MIIGTKDNCLTIVKNKNDDDTMLVLARKGDHIMFLFPDCDMFTHAYSEFQYRAFIDKHEVANVLSKSILSIEYNSFNDIQDEKLKNVYDALNKECYIEYIDERV